MFHLNINITEETVYTIVRIEFNFIDSRFKLRHHIKISMDVYS